MQPETAEPGRMQRFVTALLRHEDALVEPIEPEGLEVLAPPPVQQALGIGELARLGFGTTLPPGAQRVGIEGDWLERFARLLGARGRWMRRELAADAKAPGDPERALAHELVLDNATFRLQDVTRAWTRYLVMDFRASAVSDDKRDLIVRLGVNLATGSLPDAVVTALGPALDRVPWDEEDAGQPAAPQAALPPLWDHARLTALVQRALPPRLEAALQPFVKGMQRRLSRDQDRLYRYHNDLYHEAMRRAFGLPEGDAKRTREEQRAEAIQREYRAKLDDLERQYATRVTVDWVQTLELVTPVHRFAVQIRRRKADRMISLDWNPLARRLEPPVCEATFGTERPRLVCDDKLHLVVPAGLAPCVNCGRPFCRACHGGRCPKCGTDGQIP
ncbi:zinc ribbon domain-containing protein [Rhodopila globiformis]|uniref:Uncharacterized protein n=1 Tax=Rhodopila globiformis TaxID=1071 RepID=A0A2S6NMI2_RHOGL|nr:zinc ribbon domain-containing protein [Rhodopila globiformis]PPQ37305.1 hypothetical protein CCS01_03655 [Rhodopila globiformis]